MSADRPTAGDHAPTPGNAFTRLANGSAWVSFLAVVLIAALTIHRWHRAAWLWGVIVAFLFLRAGAWLFAARAAAADPEDALKKKAPEKSTETKSD